MELTCGAGATGQKLDVFPCKNQQAAHKQQHVGVRQHFDQGCIQNRMLRKHTGHPHCILVAESPAAAHQMVMSSFSSPPCTLYPAIGLETWNQLVTAPQGSE